MCFRMSGYHIIISWADLHGMVTQHCLFNMYPLLRMNWIDIHICMDVPAWSMTRKNSINHELMTWKPNYSVWSIISFTNEIPFSSVLASGLIWQRDIILAGGRSSNFENNIRCGCLVDERDI